MKKWIAFVCLVLIALSCVAVPVASAEDAYYLVPEGHTIEFIHRDDDVNIPVSRFVLPAGYTVGYVGLDTNGDYVRVTYGGMEGRVSATDWAKMPNTAAAGVVELPTIEVKVDDLTIYRFTGEDSMKDYTIGEDKKLLYVGNYTRTNGKKYYAVRIAGGEDIIYYALSSHTNQSEIEAALHPQTTVVDTVDKAATDTAKAKDKEFTWVRFVLILGIVVPLITIIFMIIRPRRRVRQAPREIYDNDDDYDGIDEV